MANFPEDPESIVISRQTYDRLQGLAVPLEDTPDTVIEKLMDLRDSVATDVSPPEPFAIGNIHSLEVDVVVPDPFSPPSLKHSKLVRAEVAGQDLPKPNWNLLRRQVIEIALKRNNGDLHWLLDICPINAVKGRKSNEGFSCCPEIRLSI